MSRKRPAPRSGSPIQPQLWIGAADERVESAGLKKKSGAKDATARVSTTDPDARVMKMPDGGFRPAFNIQLATTTDAARVIVGISVTNRGSDQGQAAPMLEQIEARTGVRPTELLVDGGYPSHDALEKASAAGVTVYAPVPKLRRNASETPVRERRCEGPSRHGRHRVARPRQGHRQRLSLRPHLQHPALHHRERVATLRLRRSIALAAGALVAAPRRPTPASSRRPQATTLCPARSPRTRGRRLVAVGVTAGLRSRAARRTVPTL